jgi:hypothetical protein
MNSRTTLKITLALAGLVLFGVGIRLNSTEYRWGGIALVGAAWVLRFVKPKPGA